MTKTDNPGDAISNAAFAVVFFAAIYLGVYGYQSAWQEYFGFQELNLSIEEIANYGVAMLPTLVAVLLSYLMIMLLVLAASSGAYSPLIGTSPLAFLLPFALWQRIGDLASASARAATTVSLAYGVIVIVFSAIRKNSDDKERIERFARPILLLLLLLFGVTLHFFSKAIGRADAAMSVTFQSCPTASPAVMVYKNRDVVICAGYDPETLVLDQALYHFRLPDGGAMLRFSALTLKFPLKDRQ